MARPIPPLPPETVNSTSYARPAFGRGVRADGPARRGLIRATWERSVSIQTDDFVTFRITTLNGPAAQNKGMVLFPRRIDGRYVMLSRRDRENLHLATSTDVRHWSDVTELHRPSRPWELLQIGNCGSPVETEAGWLVITHGVGPMRCYVLGALLLDLEDPRRVLG